LFCSFLGFKIKMRIYFLVSYRATRNSDRVEVKRHSAVWRVWGCGWGPVKGTEREMGVHEHELTCVCFMKKKYRRNNDKIDHIIS